MNWNSLVKDIKLFNDLVERFTSLGCDESKAYELATYVYAYKLPVVIRTQIVSSQEKPKFNRNNNIQ